MNSTMQSDPSELELLAGLVLGDLSAEEHEQAKPVVSREQANETLWELEKTAAGVQLAFRDSVPNEMPSDIAERIRHSGHQILSQKVSAGQPAPNRLADSAINQQAATAGAATPVTESKPSGGVSVREMISWFCTAAALLIAAGLWWGAGELGSRESSVATLVEQRAELISQGSGVIQADWGPGKTPFDEPVTGDVVWDGKTQSGFMRFENLPPNDPTKSQYQLWIIDPMRDDEPVDGGVFDVSSTGEVIVPIDAKLNVIQPAAFAITVEQPGGVVVSTQENLPLLAPVAEPPVQP